MKVTTPPSHSKYSKVKDGMIHGNFDNVQMSRLNKGKESTFRTNGKKDDMEYGGMYGGADHGREKMKY